MSELPMNTKLENNLLSHPIKLVYYNPNFLVFRNCTTGQTVKTNHLYNDSFSNYNFTKEFEMILIFCTTFGKQDILSFNCTFFIGA